MSKYKKLVKNTGLFAIGSLSSKLIVFAMLPLYAKFLTPEEFGKIDLFQISIFILVSLFTLEINQAILKFLLEKSKEDIMSNALAIWFVSVMISFVFLYIFRDFKFFSESIKVYLLGYSLVSLVGIFKAFIKGKNLNILYSVGEIVYTIIFMISNYIYIAVYSQGVNGYLKSFILSNLILILYYFIFSRKHISLKIQSININIMKKLLIFSVPLVPNALNWFIINSSDKIIIMNHLGFSILGLYAFSYKIPTLIKFLTQIFMQAWQQTAIEEYNFKKKSQFFNNILNFYTVFLIVITCIILVFLKQIIHILIDPRYQECWKYSGLLIYTNIFSSLSSLLGVGFLIKNYTKGIFLSSIFGGVINILINLLLIKKIGLYAAIFSSILACFSMFLIRFYRIRKEFDLKISYNIYLSFTILVVETYYFCIEKLNGYISIVFFLLMIFVNYKYLRTIFVMSSGFVRKKYA